MSCPLSVSSYPDSVPIHDEPLDVDLQFLVAPTPAKRRGGITNVIKDLFTKDHDYPTTPAIRDDFPHGTYDSSVYPTNFIRDDFSERISHKTRIQLVPATPTIDEWDDHNNHQRSWSQATSSGQCASEIGLQDSRHGLHQYPMPRSTKESIASLGLSRGCPSPESQERPDPRFMVTVCCTRDWIESPSLPPLPPLPPRKEASLLEIPSRPSSAQSRLSNSTHASEASIEMPNDCPEPSSRPPSPIRFKDRASSYIAAGSLGFPVSLEMLDKSNIIPPSSSSTSTSTSSPASNFRGHASSPSVSTVRRRVPAPAPPPIEMMGHLRVYPVLTSGFFSSKPKPPPKSKPKPTPTSSASTSPSTPSSSPSKTLPRKPVWKRFRRRHSISSFVTSPTTTEFPSTADQVASTESVNRTLGRAPSIVDSECSSPTVDMVPDRGLDPPSSVRFGSKNNIDGPYVIARTHIGGVWQETDVNDEVLTTLRNMKVSGRITPRFKG